MISEPKAPLVNDLKFALVLEANVSDNRELRRLKL